MAEEQDLLDRYVDRSALKADQDFVLATFKETSQAFDDLYNKLNTKRLTLNSATNTKDTINAVKQAGDANKEYQRILAQSASVIAKYNGHSAELLKNAKLIAQAELTQAKATKENAAAAVLSAKAQDAQAKSAAVLAKEKEKAAKASLDEQKIVDALENDYLQLSKAYNDAALKAKNYALRLGETHPVTLAAVKNAKDMHAVLLRVDQAVGQNNRNVGNYKSAFDGLGFSVTQVARELPSLTISIQQFALAVSNNLPMVADEIARAKVEIAELKKQGIATPSVFQRLMSSLVSFNVILSVGIALVTAYAGKIVEWAKEMLDGSAASKRAREELAQMNVETIKQIELFEKYLTLTRRVTGTEVRNIEVRLGMARALKKSEEEILEIELELIRARQLAAQQNFNYKSGDNKLSGEPRLAELELSFIKAKEALEEFRKTPIIDGEAVKKDSEAFAKREQEFEKALEKEEKLYSLQRIVVEEFYDSNRDAAVKEIELAEAIARRRAKIASDEGRALLEIFKIRKQAQADTQGEISDAGLNFINARLEARRKQFEAEKAIVSASTAFELKELRARAKEENLTEQDIASRKQLILVKSADDTRRLREQLSKDLLAIRLAELAKERELLEQDKALFEPVDGSETESALNKKKFDARKAAAEEARDIRLKEYEAERKDLLSRAKSLEDREKIEKDYHRKRALREFEANEQILNASIEFAEAELKIAQQRVVFKDEVERKGHEATIAQLEANLADLKLQLAALGAIPIKIETEESTEKLEKLRNKIQKIGASVISVFTSIGDIISASIDRQKNALQELIDKTEEKKQKDIEAVNASAISEQDKAAKIAIINARAASEKERLEQRQRQLDLQRARFEKAKNIMQIIVSTATAVIDGLIKGGPPLAAIYGAIGALQLGVAIAAPLPKFFKGKKAEDHYEGFGIVGDGGKRELHIRESGEIEITPDRPTRTWVGKRDRILPDADKALREMALAGLAAPLSWNTGPPSDHSQLAKEYERQTNRVIQTIKDKKELNITGSHAGVMKVIQNGLQWMEYTKENL